MYDVTEVVGSRKGGIVRIVLSQSGTDWTRGTLDGTIGQVMDLVGVNHGSCARYVYRWVKEEFNGLDQRYLELCTGI